MRRFGVKEDVSCIEVENEAVLMSLQSGSYYGLNEVGAIIWKHISQSGNPAAAIEELREKFDVLDDDACVRDIDSLCDQLLSYGLIVAVD